MTKQEIFKYFKEKKLFVYFKALVNIEIFLAQGIKGWFILPYYKTYTKEKITVPRMVKI